MNYERYLADLFELCDCHQGVMFNITNAMRIVQNFLFKMFDFDSTQAGSLGTRILDSFFHSTRSAMREDSSPTLSVSVSRSSVST